MRDLLILDNRWKQSWERDVPEHYYQELYHRLQSLTQGFKSVKDYHKEIKIVMIRVNIVHDREETMARFLNGLNRDIINIVKSQHYIKLKDVIHIAMKLERQLKRKWDT